MQYKLLILLVFFNKYNCFIVKYYIDCVTIARDAFEGFKKFKSNMYDLIILDVLMPKIDGFTLLEMIKCENKIIPIIIYTFKTFF
ncbi:MAG: response regulator [Clostridiales bacterium]|nr:response regulator [Clostridiales bacterium]